MRAEIISVGTELLLGNIIDTNAAWIARQLAVYGIDLFHKATVGDNLPRCAATIAQALTRAEAVIITGGIGPTPDDVTREAIAQALGVSVVAQADLEAELRRRYAQWNRVPTPAALKQATLPAGAQAIANPTGTAPGVLATCPNEAGEGSDEGRGEYYGERVIYALPGVPSEMRRMMEETVLPDLRWRYQLSGGLFTRVLHTHNIGESDLADRLDDLLRSQVNPTVATYVKTGEVEVRVTARAPDRAAAEQLFAPLEAEVRRRIDAFIHGIDELGLEHRLAERLRARGATLAVAESCTGGQVGERVTSQPGSSDYFRGGVVAYANEVKERLLDVPAELLARSGAVSAACAEAMAVGVARRLQADYGLATTGIAGPAGGTPDKPVGLVYVAFADAAGRTIDVLEQRFPGDRAGIRERTTLAALELACRQLDEAEQ